MVVSAAGTGNRAFEFRSWEPSRWRELQHDVHDALDGRPDDSRDSDSSSPSVVSLDFPGIVWLGEGTNGAESACTVPPPPTISSAYDSACWCCTTLPEGAPQRQLTLVPWSRQAPSTFPSGEVCLCHLTMPLTDTAASDHKNGSACELSCLTLEAWVSLKTHQTVAAVTRSRS